LERLEDLDVSNTAVSDLSPLTGLRTLRRLIVRDTPITTLAEVAQLPAVTDAAELDLTGTQVADLGWIDRAAALRVLRLIGAPAAGHAEARALSGRGVTVVD
jgi:Leucine-rich repeat (LRR) protein